MSNSKELKVKYHGNKEKKSRGRKKNPNVASMSALGYGDGSPYRSLPYIDIDTPSGRIDMSSTGIPLWANGRILPPYSGIHQFDSETVREIPLAQFGENFVTERSTTATRLSPPSVNNYTTPVKDPIHDDSMKVLIQLLDPTGISNYPDLYRALQTGEDIPLNVLGSLPIMGKTAELLRLLKGARTNMPWPEIGIKAAAVNQDLEGYTKKQAGGSLPMAQVGGSAVPREEGYYDFNQVPEEHSFYNMGRAKQLYSPDKGGHWPSIDYETGEWLKSKQHPTAWMEYLYGYTLNPQQALNYDVRTNPQGYFGENTLQYIPKKQKGGWLKEYQGPDGSSETGTDELRKKYDLVQEQINTLIKSDSEKGQGMTPAQAKDYLMSNTIAQLAEAYPAINCPGPNCNKAASVADYLINPDVAPKPVAGGDTWRDMIHGNTAYGSTSDDLYENLVPGSHLQQQIFKTDPDTPGSSSAWRSSHNMFIWDVKDLGDGKKRISTVQNPGSSSNQILKEYDVDKEGRVYYTDGGLAIDKSQSIRPVLIYPKNEAWSSPELNQLIKQREEIKSEILKINPKAFDPKQTKRWDTDYQSGIFVPNYATSAYGPYVTSYKGDKNIDLSESRIPEILDQVNNPEYKTKIMSEYNITNEEYNSIIKTMMGQYMMESQGGTDWQSGSKVPEHKGLAKFITAFGKDLSEKSIGPFQINYNQLSDKTKAVIPKQGTSNKSRQEFINFMYDPLTSSDVAVRFLAENIPQLRYSAKEGKRENLTTENYLEKLPYLLNQQGWLKRSDKESRKKKGSILGEGTNRYVEGVKYYGDQLVDYIPLSNDAFVTNPPEVVGEKVIKAPGQLYNIFPSRRDGGSTGWLKQFQTAGNVLLVTNPNDPRLRAYRDSSIMYDLSKKHKDIFYKDPYDERLMAYNKKADELAKKTKIKPSNYIQGSSFGYSNISPSNPDLDFYLMGELPIIAEFKKPRVPVRLVKPGEEPSYVGTPESPLPKLGMIPAQIRELKQIPVSQQEIVLAKPDITPSPRFRSFSAAGYPMIDVRTGKSGTVSEGYYEGSEAEKTYRGKKRKGGSNSKGWLKRFQGVKGSSQVGPIVYPAQNIPTSYYDPVADAVYLSNIQTDPETLTHEMYHKQQRDEGRLRVSEKDPYGDVRKKPVMVEEQAFVDYPYYNRRLVDQDLLTGDFLQANPSFSFVNPAAVYNMQVNPEMYHTPWTAEGEATASQFPKGRSWLKSLGIGPNYVAGVNKNDKFIHHIKNQPAVLISRRKGGSKLPPHLPEAYKTGGWLKEFQGTEGGSETGKEFLPVTTIPTVEIVGEKMQPWYEKVGKYLQERTPGLMVRDLIYNLDRPGPLRNWRKAPILGPKAEDFKELLSRDRKFKQLVKEEDPELYSVLPWESKFWAENLAKDVEMLGEKFKVYPEKETVEEWLPHMWIPAAAQSLGEAPFQSQILRESGLTPVESAIPIATALLNPLVGGMADPIGLVELGFANVALDRYLNERLKKKQKDQKRKGGNLSSKGWLSNL